MQAGSDWELCKENIQPLRKGRVMADLQSALLPPGESSVRPKLLQQKREFEVLLRSYVGEDPLEPWQAYIEWTEQNFPKGGKEGSLGELLQQCILTFKDDPRYSNDKRFVDICLKFADLSPDIMEVFQYMYSANIGVKTAVFFRSWALQHENLGNIKKADELFVEGISRGAEPKEELEMSHKQFTARILNNMHEKADQTPPESPGEHRTTLGGLKATGKNHLVGPTRTGFAKLGTNRGVRVQTSNPSNGSNARMRFPVFCDENAAQESALPPKPSGPIAPPIMPSAKKENERKPGKWTDAKIRQRVGSTPSANQKAFSVHVDENMCTPQQTPSHNLLPDSQVLSSRKAELTNGLDGLRTEAKKGANQMVMYCKEKLFRGVTEFQFEELRAIKWWERHTKLEEERKLREREMQMKKREDDLQMLTARLSSIVAKGGDAMLDEVAKCMKLMEGLRQEARTNSCGTEQLDGTRVQEDTCETKVASQIRDPDPNCSSESSSQTKSSRNATPGSTGNTSHCVRAMFNDTDTGGAQDPPPTLEGHEASKPTIRKKCAFTVYGDEDSQRDVAAKNLVMGSSHEENPVSAMRGAQFLVTDDNAAPAALTHTGRPINQPGDGAKPDHENAENLQHIPPSGYSERKSAWKAAAVLQPSAGFANAADGEEIAFEPENDFAMEGIAPLAGRDFTMCLPSDASFMNNLKISSTPTRNASNQPSKLIGPQAEKERFFKTPGTRPYVPTIDFQRFYLHGKGDLSTISEASNEYKSSSSSSSSSAATSHFKSQLLRNKTQDETSTNVDKADKSTVLALISEGDQPDFSDPFKTEVTDAILDGLPLPLTSRKGYCELLRALPVVKENSQMRLENDMYCIDKLCNTGGFAKIFCGSEMGFSSLQNRSKKFAFKVQRPACRWEFYIASELLSRLKELQNPVDVTPSIMQISKMYVYRNGSILVTEYHKQGTILDAVNYFSSRSAPFPEPLALYLTIEMMYIIEALHACNIIHADVKPDNFLVMSLSTSSINVSEKTFEKVFGSQTRCLKLIDFGRSIDMSAFPPGTTFTKSVKTDMFECCEMKDNRPWTYQADLYGLASCSHTLLFGTYMKVIKQGNVWKISSALKRYWHQTEWTSFFHQLLNVPNCGSQPDVAALRQSLEECLLTKKLLPELCSALKQLEDGLGWKAPAFP